MYYSVFNEQNHSVYLCLFGWTGMGWGWLTGFNGFYLSLWAGLPTMGKGGVSE